MLQIDSANSLAKDPFGANIVDYAIAYDMNYLLSEIKPVLVSEINESRWLAHVWNLAGSRNLGNVSAEYESFFGDDTIRIARSALSYLNHWKYKKFTPRGESENSHPLNKMNMNILERTLLRLYKKEKFDGLKIPEKPIMLKQRWFEHAAYVVFGRGDRVMKCNRGEDCGASGVRVYKMPAWNSNALPMTFSSIERTDKFMNQPEFYQWLHLSHSKDIAQKKQSIKNCASESGKAAINALFIDEALETFPDENVALTKAKFVYKDYTVFMRMRALKDYLEQSENYDVSLLTRIKEKVADLEKRKPLWAGQTAKLLDLFKKHNISC